MSGMALAACRSLTGSDAQARGGHPAPCARTVRTARQPALQPLCFDSFRSVSLRWARKNAPLLHSLPRASAVDEPSPPSSASTLLSRARELAEAGLVNEEFMQPFVADLEGELGALEALQKSLTAEAAAREHAAAALEAARAAHQRLAADFDNFRKRSAGQIASARVSGKGELLEGLLPLLDSLIQARGLLGLEADQQESSSSSSAASAKSEASHKDLVAALTSLARQAAELFRSAGLGPVAGEGAAFDPELHEAIAREARADLPDGTVIQTLRHGYTLEGRLLRPAMVRVSYSE